MSALKAVNIHPDNPNFMSEDGVVYTKSPTGGMGSELIYYPRAKQASSFTYTTPEGVQSIGTYAFYQNTKLQHLVISKDLMYINTYSFSGCTYLASITFEDRESPLTIGDYAFCDFDAMLNINYPGITAIGDYAFYDCGALETVTYGDNVVEISATAFQSTHLKTVYIPKNITR